jgi:glycerol-3-phosphate dehydrogenase
METLLQSCGLADCVASSYGGRNRKCAAQFALWLLDEQSPERSDELSDGDLESLDSAAGGPGSTATEVETNAE